MAHKKQTNSTYFKNVRLQLLYLLICIVGLYVIVPQLGSFRNSFHYLGNLRLSYLLGAIGLSILTWFFAALTYYLLALKRLRYGQTLVVQVAAAFVNRLLPGGIGAIGANYVYLHKSRHSEAEATAVIAMNDTLGFVGHLLLLGTLVLLMPSRAGSLHLLHISRMDLSLLCVLVVVSLAVLASKSGLSRKLLLKFGAFVREFSSYKKRRARLLGALFSSLGLTLTNIFCLWFSVFAVHGSLGLVPVLLVFTFGLAVGTVTPTPGGVGGIEAGLLAGLIVYHVDASVALAAVLLYRLVSYWLALAIGSVAFIYAKRFDYV